MAAEPDTYSFDQLLDELEGLSRYPDPDPADAASDTASEDGSPDGRPSSFAHFKERLREATTSMSPVTSEAEAELEQRARPSKTVSLTPRMYQDQLFEKAKRHNIIACLDTGSGKTLVSVLLLQYMYDQEIARIEGLTGNASTCSGGNAGWLSATSPRPDKRISVFCVNLVPLVHQQGDVISINSSLTVAKLYGELNVDNWNVAQWQKTLESNDVIVATARIILDALIHGFLSMKNINLIIFDEAHHARALNPYLRIMEDYYRVAPLSERPKVFGMTASPFSSEELFETSTTELEAVLDARIFTAPLGAREELLQVLKRPAELVVEYDQAPEWPVSLLTSQIIEACQGLEGVERTLQRAQRNHEEHGPLISDLGWLGLIHDLRAKADKAERLARITAPEIELLDREWLKTRDEATQDSAERLAEHGAAASHLSSVLLDVIARAPALPDKLEIGPWNCAPKILKLIEVLKCFSLNQEVSSNFCGIIFCARRQTAYALVELLKRIPELPWLHPEMLVGHEQMDWRSQNAALSRFRRRSPTNLLVSTSVLEEGLDIAPCNFVCRFDLFAHPIGYIQSRGRARHRNSRFIMMTERHNIAQRALLRTVANSDAALRVWLDGLTDDRLAQANPPLDDADNDGDGGFDGTAFLEEPSTGARLYPSDAVALVSYYVALLKGAAPEFCIESYGSGTFTCELKLPANAKVRRVVSSICPSKRKARCQAAFLACVELRKLGALDEHLVPKRPPKIGAILDSERDQTGGLLATRSRKSKFSAKIPDLWQRTLGQAEYDGAVMVLQGTLLRIDLAANGEDASLYRPILVLTANNMPAVTPFDLFLHDHTLHFPGATSSFPLRLSERQAELAYHFTLRLLRLVGRKDWQCEFADMSYLCVPVLPSSARKEVIDGHDDLDWAEVARVAMEETVPLHSVNAEDLAEHIVLENPDAHRTIAYSVERMRPDLNPYSKADEGLRETKFTNFFEYYRNVTCKHAQTLPTTCDPHQPMIEVNRLSRLENFLVTHAKRHGKLRRRQARFLIPQFTYLHSISASVHRFGLLMPSILSRISAQLMVSDLNKSQFDGRMDESALLTAVTPSAAGMAFDYERFEFLGDTVLKLLATAHVFASSAAQNEGELHLARRELVSNATLMKHSRRLKLYRFIQAKSFTNRTWCPPNFREAVNSEAVLASATGSPNKGLEDAVKKSTNSQEANIDVQMEDAITGRPHEAASTAQASAPRPSKGGKEVSNSQILNEKSLADVVEAILGAALDTEGLSGALRVTLQMGLLPTKVSSMSDFDRLYFELNQVRGHAKEGRWDERLSHGALRKLEEHLGYTFKQPYLALEAMTHPSFLASELPSYERLEILGDALLDYFVVQYIYRTYPGLDQGALTVLKSNMVSNVALGAFSEVLQLHKFLHHSEVALTRSISDFVQDARELRELERAKEASKRGQYWLGLPPPKACADVVESLVAAVVVDSGFELAAGQELFDRIFLPFFVEFCQPRTAVIHSTAALVAHIQHRGCRQWRLELAEVESPRRPSMMAHNLASPTKHVRCRMVFHDHVLGESVGTGRQNVQMRACRQAMAVLQESGYQLLDEACDCRARAREERAQRRRRQRAEGRRRQKLEGSLAAAAPEDEDEDEDEVASSSSPETETEDAEEDIAA